MERPFLHPGGTVLKSRAGNVRLVRRSVSVTLRGMARRTRQECVLWLNTLPTIRCFPDARGHYPSVAHFPPVRMWLFEKQHSSVECFLWSLSVHKGHTHAHVHTHRVTNSVCLISPRFHPPPSQSTCCSFIIRCPWYRRPHNRCRGPIGQSLSGV